MKKGDRVGILGLNGAGKSTLLKVIAGVFKPTEGKVVRNGRLVPLLELGAGFNMDYTGIENVYMNGTMMGYTKKEMDEKMAELSNKAKVILNKTQYESFEKNLKDYYMSYLKL